MIAMIAFFSAIALFTGYLVHRKDKRENRFELDSFLNNATEKNQMIFCWALNAILIKEQNLSAFVFGGIMGKRTTAIKNRYKTNLRRWWDIRSKDDVWEVVNALASCEMHSAAFRAEVLPLLADLDDGSAPNVKDKQLIKPFFDDRERLTELSLDAWDQVRAIGILGAAYTAGYLSKDECVLPVIEIGREIQSKYTSFEELGKHYYYGHLFWTQSIRKSSLIERNLKKLLVEKSSPWVQFPYSYDLVNADR